MRAAGLDIAATHLDCPRNVFRKISLHERRLEMLGRFLADLQAAVTSKMCGYHLIDLVAAEPFRCRVNDRAFRDNRYVRGSGADVDDGRGTFIGRKNPCAKGSSEALFHHEYLSDPGLLRRVQQGTLFDMRYVRDHAHHGLERYVGSARLRLFYKMREQLFRSFEIADNTADHRCGHDDIAALAAAHVGGLLAKGDDLFRQLVNGDQGRLIDDDAALANGDDGAGRTEIDSHRICNKLF